MSFTFECLSPIVAGHSAEATAFLARTSGLSAGEIAAYYIMIDGAVADGFFSKLDAWYMFATNTTTTAYLNIIQNNYNCTAPNGDPNFTADTGGLTNPSSKYLNTQFNPTTASSPHFVLTSCCLFNWCNSSALDTGDNMALLSGGGQNLKNRIGGDVVSTIISGLSASVSNTDGSGLWLSQLNSGNIDFYHNASAFSTGNSPGGSNALANSNITFFVGGNFNTQQHFGGGFGSKLTGTDISNLYARMHVYLQTIAGIP